MKKIEEKYYCDLCKKNSQVLNIKYPVLFLTDQNDGKCSRPYISYNKIDLCEDCLKKVIVIKGSGAMGFNEYKLIDNDNLYYWPNIMKDSSE